jgi:hypothetical protein
MPQIQNEERNYRYIYIYIYIYYQQQCPPPLLLGMPCIFKKNYDFLTLVIFSFVRHFWVNLH